MQQHPFQQALDGLLGVRERHEMEREKDGWRNKPKKGDQGRRIPIKDVLDGIGTIVKRQKVQSFHKLWTFG